MGDADDLEFHTLVVSVAGRWWSTELGAVMVNGSGNSSEEFTVAALRTEELTGNAAEELVVTWSESGHDFDPGLASGEMYAHTNVGVVTVDSGRPVWLAAIRVEELHISGETDPDEYWNFIEPDEEHRVVDVTFESAGFSVELEDGEPPRFSTLGRFEFGAYPVRCPSQMAADRDG